MATNIPNIPRRWADRRLTRVVGTAGLNDPAFETEEVHGMAEEIGETTTTFIRICASSRHVVHNEEEIGGVCAVCEQMLCLECAKHTCALCGECVCLKESSQTSVGDVCNNHGFFETLGFILRGGRNGKKN